MEAEAAVLPGDHALVRARFPLLVPLPDRSLLFFILVQVRAPDEHRGGIKGLVSLAIYGATPLWFAVVGAAGTAVGPRRILLFGAASVAASGVLGLSSRARRDA